MKIHKSVNDFKNDIRELYGVDLDTQLEGNEHKVDAFFNRIKLIVEQEIKAYNPNFCIDIIAEVQKEELWKAVLEQAYYMLNNYDMNIVSGYDPIYNTTVPIDEIRKRTFSPLAKSILLNAGLMYRGLGGWY